MTAPRSIALLVNPVAGSGRAREAARRARVRFAEHGLRVRELAGPTADVSRELAREAVADGVDALVVVGGDGMVHLALPAVAETGTALGVIPAGTGDDHAREYGWPRRSPEQAADVVVAGHTRRVDLGEAVTGDGRRTLFGTVLAAGFDSLVSDRTNRMRWPHGRARYVAAMLAEFAGMRPLPFVLTFGDGTVLERDLLLVAAGNTKSYGGGMRICPGADPTDGLLEVTVGGAAPRRTVLRLLPRVYRGTHVRRPEVEVRHTDRLRVESPGITAYADGEPLGALPVEVGIRRAALTLLVPEPRAVR